MCYIKDKNRQNRCCHNVVVVCRDGRYTYNAGGAITGRQISKYSTLLHRKAGEYKMTPYDTIGNRTVDALKKNRFKATYCQTVEDALAQLEKLIPPEATVGIGGSVTLQQLNVLTTLEARGKTVYNHSKPGLTPEEIMEIRRKQLTCDVFLTGTNAITQNGELVNTDGTGNRVAAMIFGPQKVIIVAGVNKIVKDLTEADERIKTIAAPLNNKRLKRPNPCVETGRCMDCQGSTRICNVTTILSKCPNTTNIEIFNRWG